MIKSQKTLPNISKEFMDSGIAHHDQRLEQWYRPENFEPRVESNELPPDVKVVEFPSLNLGNGRHLVCLGTNIRKEPVM